MGLLDNILGSGGDRQGLDDFVNRYEQGAPYDGISDDEYRQYAEQAVSRLGPDEQQQLGSFLSGRAQQQGLDVGGLLGGGGLGGMLGGGGGGLGGMLGAGGGGGPGGMHGGGGGGGMDPAALAMLMSGLNGHGGQRGFGNILGGGGGGALGNPVAKAALAGVAAMAARRMMSR